MTYNGSANSCATAEGRLKVVFDPFGAVRTTFVLELNVTLQVPSGDGLRTVPTGWTGQAFGLLVVFVGDVPLKSMPLPLG